MSIGQIGAVGRLGLTPSKGVQWWKASKHALDGISPGFMVDALNGRHALGGASVALTDILTLTNASTIRTYTDTAGMVQTAPANTHRISYASGVAELMLEGSATNLLLASEAPATQGVSVTAQTYTLSFYGSGTVALSGAYAGSKSGAASGRSTLTFTASAGTLTVTPSGSVSKWQMETGSVASSYIPTTVSAVTRPADLCQLTPAAAAILQGGAAALAWRGDVRAAVANQRLVGLGSATLLRQGDTNQIAFDGRGGASVLSLTPTNSVPGIQGLCVGWGAAGRIGQNVGGSVVSDANQITDALSTVYLGTSGGMSAGSVYRIRQLVAWSMPARPSSAGVTSQARVAT